MSQSLIAPEDRVQFQRRVLNLKGVSQGQPDELLQYEQNPYFREFHRQAEKLRRDNPGEYATDFDAQCEIGRRYPELADSAWSKTWEEAFISAVSYENRWQNMSLDQAYSTVSKFMPAGAKAVHLSQCRRW